MSSGEDSRQETVRSIKEQSTKEGVQPSKQVLDPEKVSGVLYVGGVIVIPCFLHRQTKFRRLSSRRSMAS